MTRMIRNASLLPGLLALSAPLLAHPPGMPPGMDMHDDMFTTMDANHDGRISAQEHAAAARAMFALADANHDGYLSLEELQAMHAGHPDRDAASHAPARGHDAGVPMDSAATTPAVPGLDGDARAPANGGMHHDMGLRDRFKAMDTDGDGRISASEHAAAAASLFAAMDANHDGTLSRAEFDAGHAAKLHGEANERMQRGARDDGARTLPVEGSEAMPSSRHP